MTEAEQPADAPVEVPVLHEPREPFGDIVASTSDLRAAVAALASGSGPFALDVERAGGYRYTQRAYLIQIRRAGAGTWLIDPLPFGDLAELAEVLQHDAWVLHSASQDLPSLTELGLRAPSLFDTELAGRLLGLPRVGLAAMAEQYLGYSLAKAHSAADWSTRPLPAEWLTYAALDVEPLLELREHLVVDLDAAHRTEWAAQEFEWLRNAEPTPARTEPWRRVKGLTNRSPRALAIARELWLARDEIARSRDKAPSRVLPDSAVAALVSAPPVSISDMRALPTFRRQPDGQLRVWLAAVRRAQQLTDAELPPRRGPDATIPNYRSWDRVNATAASRLERVRADVGALAEDLGIARENLVSPAVLREVVWEVSGGLDPQQRWTPGADEVAVAMRRAGARQWQVDLTADVVASAIGAADNEDSATP